MENTAAAATATTTYIAHWSHKQKVAIALICRTTLMKVESIVHPPWCRQWWVQLLNYLDLTLLEIDSSQINPRAAVDVLSKDKDIRIEVLVDLLALTLGLSSQEKHKDIAYDARARRFFFTLNYQLGLDVVDMVAVERNVAQQIFFCIQQDLQKNPDRTTDMKALAQKSIEDSHSKKKAMRWLTTGASIVGGGAIIALTGGLAAPLVAPLVAGITGATFFATAGGVALITSLFGLTGGGLAGWKMHRRTRGVKEFEFTQILKDSDLPDIPALNCTICISGYLANSKDEVQSPWIDAFSQKRSQSDVYCLAYETEELLALGHSFQRFVTNQAVRYAGVEVAKQTVLRAFFAAMALPATLLTLADVIDNPWQIATDRSRKAGIVLADVLQERVQGNRPCSLVAYSCGTLVIWHCLQELYKRHCTNIVDNVVLMGAPISCQEEEIWQQVVSTVSGRFVNCYSTKDWVLAFVYRLHSLDIDVAGLQPVKIPRIENIELELEGHLGYTDAVQDTLCRLVKIV